jgi:Flp pilus assembly CpaF family ATPase
VPRQGWAGVTNGELLTRIIPDFDIFITMDSNIVHQQNLEGLQLCLIVLHGTNSRYETLQPLVRARLRGAIHRVDAVGPGPFTAARKRRRER